MSMNFKNFFTYSFLLLSDFEIFQNGLDMKIRIYNKEKIKKILNKVNKTKNGKDVFSSILNKKIQGSSLHTNHEELKEKVRVAINEFMIMKNYSKSLENE